MITHPVTLRPALPADAPALAALGRDSFIAKFGPMYRPDDLTAFLAEQHTPQIVAGQLADPAYRIILAEREGTLTAYCKLVLACGWPEHSRGRRVIELKQLYTAPGATGKNTPVMVKISRHRALFGQLVSIHTPTLPKDAQVEIDCIAVL